GPQDGDIGIILQGGLYNAALRALAQFGLADVYGESKVPLLVLNAVYPLVPEQIARFCRGKRAVLVLEEGQPEFIEQEIATILRRADLQTSLHGKDFLPMAGEYTAEVMLRGLLGFLKRYAPSADLKAADAWVADVDRRRAEAREVLGGELDRKST